jgi:CheY-like chemotaxis protein
MGVVTNALPGFPAANRRSIPTPILVVDDDFAIRRTIAEVLIDEGYEVRSAASGREALTVITETGSKPDLILLDLWMPSMDGLEFRTVQRSLPSVADIPVLVITATRFLPRELTHLGLTHVLRKPLQLDELLRKVRALIPHKSPLL